MSSHSRGSIRALHLGISNCLIVVAFLAWTCGIVVPVRAENSDEIDLDEITRRLTEWRASFVNLRVVWELRSLPETDEAVDEWPPPPDPDEGNLFTRQEWIWADHGLDRLEDWSFFYEDGTSKFHRIDGYNGPKGVAFRAHFQKVTEDAPEKYIDLRLSDLGTGKPISHIEHDATEALYWPGFAEWLPEILSKWKWELEEVEDIGGQPCARIAATRDEGTEFALCEVLWLDLDHDCLVRRHRQRTLSGVWGKGRDFIVDEFQRLDAGIWFPNRGRSQLGGIPHENHLFVVTEVAVNESLDLTKFDPPTPPVGTAVVGHGRSYTYGTSQAPMATSASSPNSAASNSDAESRNRSAAPPMPSWFWWAGALASMAVVFAALGFWLSRRKLEDRS